MKVYHGSYTEIDVIDLSFCEMGKDFGQGFYVTNLREQAEIWANKKGKRKRKNGVVTEFEYNENLCRLMKLTHIAPLHPLLSCISMEWWFRGSIFRTTDFFLTKGASFIFSAA